MRREELRNLVEDIQQRQWELDNVEVKTAKGGLGNRPEGYINRQRVSFCSMVRQG